MSDVKIQSVPADIKGTLQSYLVGGTFQFREKNYGDASKRVQLVLRKGNGEKENISCSEPMSKELRAGTVMPGHLLGFDVADVTNNKGEVIRMLIMPETGLSEAFSADDTAVLEFKPQRKFLPEAFFAGV